MTIPNNANIYLRPVIAIPSALEITAITQANPMVVTTTMNSDQVNTYIAGQVVALTIPANWGMWQANGLKGQITSVNGANLTLNINSLYFDAFVNPMDGSGPASLAPSGSRNLQIDNTTGQVPFQSLNNIGN
jgi:hypothetical protein